MTTIEFNVSGNPLSTYIATPEGEGPWPGVCVIHDALGSTTQNRQKMPESESSHFLQSI